ncbi:MAG TPA: hypothetical protein VF429_04315, partial [Anaerolineae bacterium]
RAEVEQAWRAIQPATARDKREWLSESARGAATHRPSTQVPLPLIPGWAKDESAAPPSIAQLRDSPAATQVPGWAEVEPDIKVRRARRSDWEALGVAIAKSEHRAQPLARDEALKRLGERGYRLAMADHRVVALAAWDAENLVATAREVWVESVDLAPIALPKLLALIETEAKELLCEVVLLLIDESVLTLAAEARALGYEERTLPALHSAWQEIVRERLKPTDQIWCKRLREGITTKPV